MPEHIGDRAPAFVMGELPDAERAAIQRHLAGCARCRHELDEVKRALDAVGAWPAEPSLPTALEDRIVRSVAADGVAVAGRVPVVPATGRPWWRSGVAAAVLVGVLSATVGFGAGRLTSGPRSVTPPVSVGADSTLHSYMLLLEEPVWPPAQPLARNGYGAWTRAIAAESRFVDAEKFTEEPGFRVNTSGAVTRPRPADVNYSGWYIVRARNYDEAIDWARRGPHLSYGSVLVREIEP
jgi:hypothetical protein